MRWWSLSLFIVSVAILAEAQQPTKWECAFTTASSYEGRSEKDREASQFKVIPQQLAMTFLVADTKAYVMGNNGASEVTMVTTESGGSGGLNRPGFVGGSNS